MKIKQWDELGEQYITLSEVAKMSGIKQTGIKNAIRRGRLKAKKFRRNWYTIASAVIEYMISRSQGKRNDLKS